MYLWEGNIDRIVCIQEDENEYLPSRRLMFVLCDVSFLYRTNYPHDYDFLITLCVGWVSMDEFDLEFREK